MRAVADPNVFRSEVYQLRNKLSGLNEVVSTERLTIVLFNALPAEKYSARKIQGITPVFMGTKFGPKILKFFIRSSCEFSAVEDFATISERKYC